MKLIHKSLFVCLCALFLSCGTSSNVYDTNLAPEETALLKVDPSWTVKSYNGIPVDLERKAMGITGFTIPAGPTELVMDLSSARIGDTYYRAKNVVFSYNFEAGKEYLIRFWFSGEDGRVLKVVGFGTAYPSIIVEEGENKEAFPLKQDSGPTVLE